MGSSLAPIRPQLHQVHQVPTHPPEKRFTSEQLPADMGKTPHLGHREE
jgi:hypothetical protein